MKFLSIIAVLCQVVIGPALAGGPMKVAAVNSILADFARQVGGDDVAVSTIIGPGQNPHEFSPSPNEVRAVHEAEVVLMSGLGLESGFLGKLKDSARPNADFVIIGDAITPMSTPDGSTHAHSHDHDHGEETHTDQDPHWWHSIANARIATKVICEAFAKADPQHADSYRARAEAYDQQLNALARWARLTLVRVPRDRRVLITSHDAFGYFARDYEFKIRPLSGLSTRDKPSSKSVRDTIAAIRSEGVQAIFLENTENPKVLTEITRETGAKVGGILYAGSLAEPEAPTYEAMIRHNISTIVEALEKPDQ